MQTKTKRVIVDLSLIALFLTSVAFFFVAIAFLVSTTLRLTGNTITPLEASASSSYLWMLFVALAAILTLVLFELLAKKKWLKVFRS